MYKAQIVNCGIRITKIGNTPKECLDQLEHHLKIFHQEDHKLRHVDGNVYTDHMCAENSSCIGDCKEVKLLTIVGSLWDHVIR